MTLVGQRIALPGAANLRLLQPEEATELPDDGPVEWAPLMPYWSVLWRSGVALGQELASERLDGLRVAELGCGLAVPSLVAARAGARVLATDGEPEALELVQRNASETGVEVETLCADWEAAAELAARGPFDLVLAADVLYERSSAVPLLALLPRLGEEVWLADPGRQAAVAFLEEARQSWSVTTTVRDGIDIHRLRAASSAARLAGARE